jgi:uncharacterized protein involved in type VI secretion and phage assembly
MIDELFTEAQKESRLAHVPGVVVGIVTNNRDPQGMGRVKVKLPHLCDADESDWARIVAPMAGKERGIYFLPELDDEVLVAFEHGNPRLPLILGAMWNGKDSPPAKNDDGKNDVRVIRSRSGHLIRFTDRDHAEKIEIIDGSGKNSLVFDTAANLVEIKSGKDITLSAASGTIKLHAQKIEITASGPARIEAASRIDVKATRELTLKGATIDLN